jgi:hypothetical protein
VRLVLAAVLCLAVLTVAAPTATAASCGKAAAKAAIAKAKPKIKLLGPKQLITPDMASVVVCSDLTRDGKTDMAVSIASGGTAGDVGWIVFTPAGAGWKIVFTGSGYKLAVFRAYQGDLLVVTPVYKGNDPNCCPTGGFDHTQYHWNGSKFVVGKTWHTKKYSNP